MNVTIQVPAPANVVLSTTYDVCNKNFEKIKSSTQQNSIRLDALTALVHIKSKVQAIYFFTAMPFSKSTCNLTINCDYNSYVNKSTEPELFRLTDKIIGLLFDELKLQGYIK